MRKVLAVLTALLFFGGLAGAADDVTSSKNEVLAKGTSPHVRLFDTDGTGNFGVSVDHGVFQFTEEQVNGLFSAPSDAKLGIAFTPPASLVATASNTGGHLATGTYFIVVTALDGGTGETFASNEVSCVITTGSVGSCALTWVTAPPPTASYLVYVGTATGSENVHFPAASTSFTLKCSAAGACSGDGTGTSGTPPAANTAFLVYLDSAGVHFADGSSMLTAAGAGAWMANGPDWISAGAAAKYGISSDGHVFTPDALLEVLGTFHATGTITGGGNGTFSGDVSGVNGTFSGRVKGTTLVHQFNAAEQGQGSFDTFSSNATCALPDFRIYNTITATFSGTNVVSIRGSIAGVMPGVAARTNDMITVITKDGSVVRTVDQQSLSLGGSSDLPWSATIDYEETPSAGSHTYTLRVCAKASADVGLNGVNASYFNIDEMP